MSRWWRNPALHFVFIGGLLFMALDLLPHFYGQHSGAGERSTLAIPVNQVRQLRSDFVRQWGLEPTDKQSQAMIRQTVDDEILYREARRLALGFGDRDIRGRLVQKMRAASTETSLSEEALYHKALALGFDDDLVIRRLLREKMRILLQQEPGIQIREKDVTEYIEHHPDRFLEPPKISFRHLFLSARSRGNQLEQDAKALLEKLHNPSVPPERADERSDAFILGQQFQDQSRTQIASRFGANFADEVFGLGVGLWSGPLVSPYGLHIVWVQEKDPAKMPPLQAILKQAAYALLEERSATALAAGMRRLRNLYDVHIEGDQPGIAQLTKGGELKNP